MKSLVFIAVLMGGLQAHAYPEVNQIRPSLYPSLPSAKCPVKIVPNQSIGEIKIGMSEEEIKGTGLTIHQGPSHWLIVGPYQVQLSEKTNQVVQIAAELADLPPCLEFNKIHIAQSATAMQLTKVFNDCQKTEILEGGNRTSCRGLEIGTGGWGGTQKSPSIKIPPSAWK